MRNFAFVALMLLTVFTGLSQVENAKDFVQFSLMSDKDQLIQLSEAGWTMIDSDQWTEQSHDGGSVVISDVICSNKVGDNRFMITVRSVLDIDLSEHYSITKVEMDDEELYKKWFEELKKSGYEFTTDAEDLMQHTSDNIGTLVQFGQRQVRDMAVYHISVFNF